jgi:Bacterial archaeo-eukaryotic release factor family 11
MLHVDIPSRSDIEHLISVRAPGCVSIYLRTTPITQEARKDRIELKNLGRTGLEQLRATDADKRAVASIGEAIDDLADDDEFWRFQANSLAVFAMPESTRTFRLPNRLEPLVEVSDRFHVKPLLRCLTVPQTAFVLALAQGSVRIVEVAADMPAFAVRVEGMPKDAASAVQKASILDRSPSRRIQGSEGQKVRLRQYARQVDNALRDLLGGREIPLILAATAPLDAIFRSVNTYPHLVDQQIAGNPESLADADLAQASRRILDDLFRTELEALHRLFETRAGQGRTTADVAQAARAATFGAVDTLLVDIDAVVPGTVDDEGRVELDDTPSARTYGVIDQIAVRAFLAGARVLGVRRDDLPGGGSVAAILRYPF